MGHTAIKVNIVHFKVLGISPSFTKEDMKKYAKPPHRPGDVRHKEAINTAHEVIVDELKEYDDCLHVIENLDDLHTVLSELPIEQHGKVLADLTERLEPLGFSTLGSRRTLLNSLVSSKDDILTLLHALPNDVSCHTIMFLRRLDNFQKFSRGCLHFT